MHGVFHMSNHLIWYLAGAEELFAKYGYGNGFGNGYGYGLGYGNGYGYDY